MMGQLYLVYGCAPGMIFVVRQCDCRYAKCRVGPGQVREEVWLNLESVLNWF